MVSYLGLDQVRTSQQHDTSGVVCTLSISNKFGGGRNGWALSSMVRGEGHRSHMHSQPSACRAGFLFLALLLPSSILVFACGHFPGKGMPHTSGQCWPLHQAELPMETHALGLGWRNQSLVGSWGNWRVEFPNKAEDWNLPNEDSTKLQLYPRAQPPATASPLFLRREITYWHHQPKHDD